MANLNFDPNEVPPATPFEVLPVGDYLAMISGSEIKDTKAGTGQYVKLEYTVLDGEHQNRKLWSQHNIVNANAEAERIAKSELSAICLACGIKDKLTDTGQLHDIPMTIKVAVRKGDGTYQDQNVVKAWSPAVVTQGSAPAAKPASTPRAPAQAAAAKPAWAKNRATA